MSFFSGCDASFDIPGVSGGASIVKIYSKTFVKNWVAEGVTSEVNNFNTQWAGKVIHRGQKGPKRVSKN